MRTLSLLRRERPLSYRLQAIHAIDVGAVAGGVALSSACHRCGRPTMGLPAGWVKTKAGLVPLCTECIPAEVVG